VSNLAERVKILIDSRVPGRSKFAWLESIVGQSADSWKSFYHSRQRPTAEMIEALCKHWPEYAFWLGTGYTDSSNGHISPTGEANDMKREVKVQFRVG
jgi:hypothetical protein